MWTAHLFKMSTGQVGPRLNFASVSWTMELNGVETMSYKLRKSDLPQTNLKLWLSPWWAGVVLFYNGDPIVAGPILTRPQETFDSVSIACGGIRSVLQKRFVTEEQSDWSKLAGSVIHFDSISLGTIAQKVVQRAQMKPAGGLPIQFPIPEQTAAQGADHERTYNGFNLQNINAHDVLNKLSNVIDGPDIMFKPKMIRDNQLMFQMYHGTEDQPRIKQSTVPVWDTTPNKGDVEDLTVTVTGSYQTSRVYSTGAGTDKGVLIKVATNEAPLQAGYPLLESVINVGNSDKGDLVAKYGIANLFMNREPLLEVQMTVRCDGNIPIGKFWPGDLVHVYTEGWLSLPDGMNEMRLLSISGNDSNKVKISLQLEDKFV